MEFADRALAHPVAVLVVLLGLDDRLLAGFGDIVGLVLAFLACLVLGSVVGVVEFALRAALDHQGLVVGEFNVDVLLRDAGQFAVKVVGVVALTEVEARGKRAERGELTAVGAVEVAVVQETEERSEVSGRRDVEKRHCGIQRLFFVKKCRLVMVLGGLLMRKIWIVCCLVNA